MKLLVLIIAHDEPIYIKMQEQWKRYMNKIDDIKCYFLKYKSELTNNIEINETENTIYIHGDSKTETIRPGALDKTIKSLEFLLNNNYNFDYLIRTNLSSVWNFYKLYDFLNVKKCKIAGFMGNHYDSQNCINYINGAGLILHIDVCKLLIQHKHLLNYNIFEEDVAIGNLLFPSLTHYYISLKRSESYNYQTNYLLLDKEIETYEHFRCKCDNMENNIPLMKHIIDKIYY